ncbi:type I secretion system permease/ATPase [Methylobacterium mesophilicum]|uniref:type I secretion system permease/ATPase n=1 Tax=Methylobacterium mesophilicum TaxID=39956 RepID=UPI001EE21FA3|nr:type I secretion system permease/ATPase [Methylobacterium mesophilicum]GJE23595.1 Type I secretion system ATP-binding protein PrsD [Methylobacterium mesophilicum]
MRADKIVMAYKGSIEIRAALTRCRSAFIGVAVMSCLLNLLYLTGSFFMLEVYDRVIPSRSMPTLLGLCTLAFVLYSFQGAIEILRTRILTRVGMALDEALSARVFNIMVRAPLKKEATHGDGLLPLRDLETIRAFFGGSGPSAFFDLPWMPIYLVICILFHPLIGIAAIIGVAVLAIFALLTDRATRTPALTATTKGSQRNSLAEAGGRNAEVIAALGMQERFAARWGRINYDYMQDQQKISDVAGSFGATSKIFRIALQSAVLALGAYLVINGQASAGIIIASTILVARALAPAELAIANWKSFVQARQSWMRLSGLFNQFPVETPPHAIPAPRQTLDVMNLSIAPPGSRRLTVQNVSFSLKAGQGLGIIGPSASGKTSLARALVGVWAAVHGEVRLDGAELAQWTADDLGEHVGFLPQEIELFAGTIAENIARFHPSAPPEATVTAARAAGVHEMILRLPQGYDTRISERGSGLSAGQRQRVGLARALYGDPFLVILDEPNANLDAEGENALTDAILGVRSRGGICIVIAHRPSALVAIDLILMLSDGRIHAIGPKDQVLNHVLKPAAVSVNNRF